jgi:primosomal protein N'
VSTPRAVRIITEVAAVDRPFDYAVTEATAQVAVGDRVRVDFNHRSVRGWVLDEAEPSAELKPLTKWLGYGPPASLLALLSWASERWYSPLSRFLISTSPRRLITSLPVAPASEPLADGVRPTGPMFGPGVIVVAPTTDPLPLVLGAYEATRDRPGSLLVLVPTEAWANRLRGRLEQRGCAVASGEAQWDRMRAGWPVVVGARGTALAPVPRVRAAVIIDADDEAYRSEAAPTWSAFGMLSERCRRDDAPLWATSMIPAPELVGTSSFQKVDDVSAGWPRVEFVDRRLSDPHDGVLSREALDAAHRALGGDEPVAVVVVLQRLGTGRLFACRRCGELARCATCAQGEQEFGEMVACREQHELRAPFCRACGATNLKRVRVGVTTLARDVAAQLSQAVSEITASSDPETTLARVVVGTEAVWQRVRRCSVVIFVDFDQYLLAPRASARREAIMAVGKAGRLVGSRCDGRGPVLLQTRRGEDSVITALTRGDFDEIIDNDVETARLLGLAPFGAEARVSGPGAEHFVDQLRSVGLTVDESAGVFAVRAPDVDTLTRKLRAAQRPIEKLRVAVR